MDASLFLSDFLSLDSSRVSFQPALSVAFISLQDRGRENGEEGGKKGRCGMKKRKDGGREEREGWSSEREREMGGRKRVKWWIRIYRGGRWRFIDAKWLRG